MPKDKFKREREHHISSAIRFARLESLTGAYRSPKSRSLSFPCKSRNLLLEQIIKELKSKRENLTRGALVKIHLGKQGGYPGRYTCKIDPASSLISVEYYGDPSRFPARIKAVCVALCLEKIGGTFLISHNNGVVRILRGSK